MGRRYVQSPCGCGHRLGRDGVGQGYRFDDINWCDDMVTRGSRSFLSICIVNCSSRPTAGGGVARSKGMKARLHSCGDIHTLVPDLIEIGIDMLNPIEVKAGMDPSH